MAYKYRHECERCGLQVALERVGRFRDDDYHELLQDYFALELELHQTTALRQLAETRLAHAYERIEQMRELIKTLPDPVPDVEFLADAEEVEFY